MNSDETTEFFFPGNIGGVNLVTKNLTRDIPTTSTSYAVDIGTWTLSNGTAFFEISIQVNKSGFTIHKEYRFSVISNATSGAWNLISPEVDTGASGSNNFALEINSNGSSVALRIHRTGGSTAGEAKIFIKKYGNVADTFSSSSSSGIVSPVSTVYPRSYGVNYVVLDEVNTFTANQTINAQFTAKGDNTNYPAVRLGAGTTALSNNVSKDGSVVVQGTTSQGVATQFEIISPNNTSRLGFEANNSNGVTFFGLNNDIKFNQNSGSLVIAGINSDRGLMFSTGINSGTSSDVGLVRINSGNLRLSNGSTALGSLSVSKLRINSTDTTKTQDLYISGASVYIESTASNPAYIASKINGPVGAFVPTSSGVMFSYDSTGIFSIASQTNAQIKSAPGAGSSTSRFIIDSNGNVGIGVTPLYKLSVNGTVAANSFFGDGNSLSNLSSSSLQGTIPTGLMPAPGINSLGGVKRNVGSAGNIVTGISSDGTLLYGAGFAQNQPTKTLAIFKPSVAEPLSSGTMATYSIFSGRPILNFSGNAESFAAWSHIIPEGSYLSGGINFNVWWSCDVTVGNVAWELALERLNEGVNISSGLFYTTSTISAATVPASGLLKKGNATFTTGQLGSLSAGEMFRVRLKRDTDNDTANGIAQFHQLEMKSSY